MARLKIDYGIDLGTTNSAICRIDQGNVSIIKTDVGMDTLPSCVSFTKKQQVRVGNDARNDMVASARRATKKWQSETNAFVEFKRIMGTDEKFTGRFMPREYSPEQLSAEVLKKLRSFVTDDEVKSVVITVPAKFTVNKKDATMRAAKLAGFEHCELLQEPVAASFAYGIKADNKNGIWLVFDFGGGTFDAALLKVEDGIMQVFDTEGNDYLGGKNLDYAIVDEIIIPYLKQNFSLDGILSDKNKRIILREAMKTYAEQVKIALSFKENESIESDVDELGVDDNDSEIELFMDLSREDIEPVLAPHFQKAIDIVKDLLERNNLTGSQLSSLILVGGPTYTPVLRKMLKEQITLNVDYSIDPMTAVASGAALYASTIDSDVKESLNSGTVALQIRYESTSAEAEELVTIKLDSSSTSCNIPNDLKVEIIRGDKGWSSGLIDLTEKGKLVSCILMENKPNCFFVNIYDGLGNKYKSFPSDFTIIQGSVVGSAVLPYHIGMEVWDSNKSIAIFKPIKGLEKNMPLPAIGVYNNLKTTNDLLPGNPNSYFKIPIYQGDEGADEGLPAACYHYVYEARLTGLDLPSLLPMGSDIDITVKVDRSETIKMEVFIPMLNYSEEIVVPRDTVQKTVSDDYLNNEISKAYKRVEDLDNDGEDTNEIKEQLKNVENELNNGDEKGQVLDNLKRQLRKIAKMDKDGEWMRYEKKLRSKFSMLKDDNRKYGNSQTTIAVDDLGKKVDSVIQRKNIAEAIELLDQIFDLDMKLARVEYYIAWVSDWASSFDEIQWTDRIKAREYVNKGMEIITDTPSADKLHPIVSILIRLIPKSEMPKGAAGLLEI